MQTSNFKILWLSVFMAVSFAYISCKPKDADIQTAVNNKLKENPDYADIQASVTDGVVTLSGNCASAGCDASATDAVKPVKGVKEVKSNISVAPPVAAPAPVEITADDSLKIAVNDAVTNYKDVTATVSGGVVTLTGKIKRSDLQGLMMKLHSLKPKKIDNQLTIQ